MDTNQPTKNSTEGDLARLDDVDRALATLRALNGEMTRVRLVAGGLTSLAVWMLINRGMETDPFFIVPVVCGLACVSLGMWAWAEARAPAERRRLRASIEDVGGPVEMPRGD